MQEERLVTQWIGIVFLYDEWSIKWREMVCLFCFFGGTFTVFIVRIATIPIPLVKSSPKAHASLQGPLKAFKVFCCFVFDPVFFLFLIIGWPRARETKPMGKIKMSYNITYIACSYRFNLNFLVGPTKWYLYTLKIECINRELLNFYPFLTSLCPIFNFFKIH